MKRQHQAVLVGTGAIIVLSALAVPAYAQGMRWNSARNSGNGTQSTLVSSSSAYSATQAASVSLSAAESSTLQYMLEEEKLAHDIYIKMYEKWGVKIFTNISKSESKHQSLVADAATTFDVADTRTSSVGVFTNPDLQNLYNDLLLKGLNSQMDAYEVGRSIEELDIADLQKAIDETESAYLESVYGKLLSGSKNHLKAFSSRLSA